MKKYFYYCAFLTIMASFLQLHAADMKATLKDGENLASWTLERDWFALEEGVYCSWLARMVVPPGCVSLFVRYSVMVAGLTDESLPRLPDLLKKWISGHVFSVCIDELKFVTLELDGRWYDNAFTAVPDGFFLPFKALTSLVFRVPSLAREFQGSFAGHPILKKVDCRGSGAWRGCSCQSESPDHGANGPVSVYCARTS